MKFNLLDLIKNHRCKYHMRCDNRTLNYRKSVTFRYSVKTALKEIYESKNLPIAFQITASPVLLTKHPINISDIGYLFSGTIFIYKSTDLEKFDYTIQDSCGGDGNCEYFIDHIYCVEDEIIHRQLITEVSRLEFTNLSADSLSMAIGRFLKTLNL